MKSSVVNCFVFYFVRLCILAVGLKPTTYGYKLYKLITSNFIDLSYVLYIRDIYRVVDVVFEDSVHGCNNANVVRKEFQ